MPIVNVVSHNLGGGTTYGTGLYSDGIAPVGTVKRVTQSENIDIVTLQEVLLPEYQSWVDAGWYGVFVAMTTADENKFRGYEDKGQAILSKYPILDYDVIPLPVVEGVVTKKDFSLLVAKIEHPKFDKYKESLWVATTHLWSAGLDPDGRLYDNNKEIRELQAKEIATYFNRRVRWARRYILTGDFNTGPKTEPIDLLHRVNQDGSIGRAKFWEGDQALYGGLSREGRPTVNGRKIDYFFAQHKGVDPVDGIGTVLINASANDGDAHDKILHGWVRFTGLTRV